MNEKYFTVNVLIENETKIEQLRQEAFRLNSTGIEEFSLDEAQVDAILGERSYSGADIPESVIDEVSDKATSDRPQLIFYFKTVDEAQEFDNFVKSNDYKSSGIQEFSSEDWNAKWRESYRPIKISDDFEIVPSWEKGSSKNSLYIYPGMGFGTGSHETTFLCLKSFVENLENLNPKDCLDFGCGSGILGLATYFFNPKIHVDFYDIDQAAIDNTIQNLELNHLEEKSYQLLLPDNRKKINEKYDLVFANILKNVLEFESEYLANSCNPKGLLILSGLLKGQEEDITSLYLKTNKNLELVSTLNKGDWMCIVFRNK